MPINFLREFIKLESRSSVILIISALIAVIIANSSWQDTYINLLNHSFKFQTFNISIMTSFKQVVNEGLMTFFFLLISLELKREFLIGELNTRKKALLPFIASIGGMGMAALTFLIINNSIIENQIGWAIPTATDVAFASSVLILLGKSVPRSLKIFLIALAITDDIGAVFIISIFYTQQPDMIYLLTALLVFSVLIIVNLAGIVNKTIYVVFGILLWILIFKANINSALAGALIGFTIPLRTRHDSEPPLQKLERVLHPWVVYGVLPLFAFVNGGLTFSGLNIQSFFNPLTLGIMLGLFLGKQIGVFGACFIAVKLRVAKLPSHINWKHIYGVSLLCGIGFTMNLFIGFLAFPDNQAYLNLVKLGIFSGTIISSISGYTVLKLIAKKSRHN